MLCDRSFFVFFVSSWFVKKGCWGVEECDSLRLCSFATLRETLCVLCVWSGSLKKDVWELRGAIAVWVVRGSAIAIWGVKGCDSEALRRNRYNI
jgi:hypothetical protein